MDKHNNYIHRLGNVYGDMYTRVLLDFSINIFKVILWTYYFPCIYNLLLNEFE